MGSHFVTPLAFTSCEASNFGKWHALFYLFFCKMLLGWANENTMNLCSHARSFQKLVLQAKALSEDIGVCFVWMTFSWLYAISVMVHLRSLSLFDVVASRFLHWERMLRSRFKHMLFIFNQNLVVSQVFTKLII